MPNKGTTYGGLLHWPEHPAADMHGLVRAVVRVRGRLQVARAVEQYGLIAPAPSLWLQGIWSESKSAAEIQATESRFGQLLVCPVSVQYLHAESYRAPDRKAGDHKAGGF